MQFLDSISSKLGSKFKLKSRTISKGLWILLTFSLLCSISFSQTCISSQYNYVPASLCIDCPLACSTCTDSLTCTNCYSSATIVATLSTKKCYCPNGKFYDPFALICDPCNKVIQNCNKCSVGLISSVCLTCNSGYYLYSATSCALCPPKCKTCTSATVCQTCIYAEYDLVGGACVCASNQCLNCEAKIDPNCINCDAKNCKKCQVGYVQSGSNCIACTIGCLKCTTKDCNTCFSGYFLDTATKTCTQCSSFFSDPFCTECESTQCTVCAAGYRLNMATRICEPDVVITCLPTQVLILSKCINCFIIFDPLCDTCDSFGCLTCQTGYMIDTNTNACMKIPVCGDGDWVLGYQNCDDRNFIDGDGCSAKCQVETDYQCLDVDKLTTGESYCKYMKDFVVNFLYVLKAEQSNIGYFYFAFEGSTFLLWNEVELTNFLSPISIVDANTGTGNPILYNSLKITLSVVNGQTLFCLGIDYGLNNIENAYIQFSMDPSLTSLPQINYKPAQPAVYYMIDSKTNGVNLYNYGPVIYEMQTTISTLSGVLGYTSFVFLLLGLICPTGKIVVLEALAVIQLGFFTVLQFDKIPPTFIGLRNLLPSSGINDINVMSSVQGQYEQLPCRTMGLDTNIFANYNLSFGFIFIVPFLIGLIGFIIVKFVKTKIPRYNEAKDSLLSADQKKKLKNIDINNHFTDKLQDTVFKRMIFQVSFYGLMSGGYLSWVSVFYSLKSPDGVGIFGFILILLIWITYSILFFKIHTQELYLPQHYTATFAPHNTMILNGFGEFRDVHQQISKQNFYYSYAVEKIYLAFIFQRILIPIFIVYISDLFAFASIILAVVYLILMGFLVSSYRKYQNKKVESDRKPLFSYLHRNYVLRQCFNFGTTIIVQICYFIQALHMQDTTNFINTLSVNYLTTELIPVLILSFLYINFAGNIFLWIWELKSTQIIRKTMEMKKFFFSEKDLKPYSYSGQKAKKKTKNQGNTKNEKNQMQNDGKNQNTKRSVEEEDKAIQNTMRRYAEKNKDLTSKNSPFLGYTEHPRSKSYADPDSGPKLNVQLQTMNPDSTRKPFSRGEGI